MRKLLIYACFFLSGFCALVYQVVWVREFGNIFGNNIYSASIVIAVFMCGLGVGSWVAGHWADRQSRLSPHWPLHAYGWFEIGIGALGFGIALLLPAAEIFSASISAYQPMANGWQELTTGTHLALYGLAIVVLTPSTVLMGGTLTLLIRYFLGSDLAEAGWRVGTLYGINTLGAALGAFSVDFWLIPAWGLFKTQSLAVVVNLLVGAIVLRMAAGFARPATAAPAAAPDNAVAGSSRLVLPTATAIFLSGFAALGMEIIWFRVLSSIFGLYRSIFSLLLTMILVGIWLGSWLGGFLHKRYGNAATLYIGAQAVFVASAVAGLTVIDNDLLRELGSWFRGLDESVDWSTADLGRQLVRYPVMVGGMLVAVGIPALMMGFAYPLANAITQKTEAVIGGRSGLLYFANTIGAVLGSLVVGFYLLPTLGSKHSVSLMLLLAILAMVPLAVAARADTASLRRPALAGLAAGLVVALLALMSWHRQDDDFVILKSNKLEPGTPVMDTIISKSEGILETILIKDERPVGKGKVLVTNGHNMSGTDFLAQRYMRAFSHLPLLMSENPRDAIIICFGVGNTLHATTLHESLDRIDVVDLSEHVLRHNRFFSDTNFGAIDDPRVRVFVNDGRQHLRMQPDDTYDLVTLEPPPISFAGVASLYSTEFYELARRKLKPGGYMTQWLPYLDTSRELTFSIVRAFVDAFPNAVMLAGTFSDIILVGRNADTNVVDHRQLLAALADNPAVRADLERFDMGTLTEILGSFLAAPDGLRATLESVPAVTDDYPIMEYLPRFGRQTSPPSELIDVWSIGDWCRTCVDENGLIDGLDNLDVYLKIMHEVFETGEFDQNGQLRVQMDIDVTQEAYDRAVAETPFLSRSR